MSYLFNVAKKSDTINKRLGYLLEIANYAQAKVTKSHLPTTKFVIFGTGRSGSTLLVDMLRSNPQIHCDNELFHRKLFNPISFVERRSRMFDTAAYGFKCLTYQIYEVLGYTDHKKFICDLHALGYKIIYLQRKDTLMQALSNIYARHRNVFHARANAHADEVIKINVDLDVLDDWMQRLDAQKRFERTLLQDIPHLNISYEKDLKTAENHGAATKKICDFLEVANAVSNPSLRKFSPTRLEDYIENLSELRNHLSQTELAAL